MYEEPVPGTLKNVLTSRALYLFAALILIAAAILFRASSLKRFDGLYDELITRAIVLNIWKGNLSNNWRFADVPAPFKQNCYNFSSYLYVDAFFTGPNPHHGLYKDRIFSAVVGSLAILPFTLVALKAFEMRAAVAALAIMAFFPLLVQDSHYARPEAFVTLLFALVYLLVIYAVRRSKPLPLFLLSGFLCGVLIACKISFFPSLAISLLCLWGCKTIRPSWILFWIASVFAGTFAGVPDAFLHPSAFMQGVAMLRNQYSHEHPPFSLPDSASCIRLLASYFWQTLGPVSCILAGAGVISVLIKKQYSALALFVAPLLFYLTFFSLQRTFFERNLSHIAPLLAILCGVGIAALASRVDLRWQPAAYAVLLTAAALHPMLICCRLVWDAMRVSPEAKALELGKHLQEEYKNATLQPVTPLLVPYQVVALGDRVKRSAFDLIVPAPDFHDPYTLHSVKRAKTELGVREIGYSPSVFPAFLTNTIIAYHAFGIRFLLARSPEQYQVNGLTFTSVRSALEPVLKVPVIFNSSWARNGVPPDVKIPPVFRSVLGSYTTQLSDANRGQVELGPIALPGSTVLGLPILTGPSQGGLSLTIRDHATHRILAEVNPLPSLPLWNIWKLPVLASKDTQIDIIAVDNGSAWGQWFAMASPMRLRE